jgi:hypothetical protein
MKILEYSKNMNIKCNKLKNKMRKIVYKSKDNNKNMRISYQI